MGTGIRMTMESIHRSRKDGMRRSLPLVAWLALVISLTSAAKADPIMGNIVMTVAPSPPAAGTGLGIPTAAVYSSGPVDLSTLPQNLPLTGPALGFAGGGLIGQIIKTTFDLKITFNGAAGSQPSIDVTGPLTGWANYSPSPDHASSWFQATPTSATLHGWTVGSGVPMDLINQYLNTSNYHVDQLISASLPPDRANFALTVDPSTGVTTPEPATVLVYLVAIAGLGVRRGARAWRSFLAR